MEEKQILMGERLHRSRNTIKAGIWYFKEVFRWKEAERWTQFLQLGTVLGTGGTEKNTSQSVSSRTSELGKEERVVNE